MDSIARSLMVGTIVEGSVDLSGEQLKVTVRLIDADGAGNCRVNGSNDRGRIFLCSRMKSFRRWHVSLGNGWDERFS